MSSSPVGAALPAGVAKRLPVSSGSRLRRALPVGAECQPDGGVHFRVWAPRRKQVRVVMDIDGTRRELALTAEGTGYFSGLSETAGAGTLYRFQLDTDDT